MTYTFEEAARIAERYQFLIGTEIEKGSPKLGLIKHVAVCPFDGEQFSIFLNTLISSANGKTAIQYSGYDPSKVEVKLFAKILGSTDWLHSDLDKHLTMNDIPKIY